MSEACGFILLQLKANLADQIIAHNYGLPKELLELILSKAKLSRDQINGEFVPEVLALEGISAEHGFVHLEISGDDWMRIAELLVRHGKEIELYGHISQEHGYSQYYSKNIRSSLVLEYSSESLENVDESSVIDTWLSSIPPGILESFSTVFSQYIDHDSSD